MRLIVISRPDFFEEEAGLIDALFAAGMEHMHLRKPGCTRRELRALITNIDRQNHSRLTLHHHHDLTGEFDIRRLHFPEKHRSLLPAGFLQTIRKRRFRLSTSIHDLAQVKDLSDTFSYTFYGPVFDSISKPGHRGTVNQGFVLQKDFQRPKIIALGGIDAHNINQIKSMHFDGAAVLGAVWQSPDPVEAFTMLRSLDEQREINQLHFISNETEDMCHIASIRIALDAGFDWIQLRVKNKAEDEVLQLALEAKELCDKSNAKLIINDFPRVAKAVSAYGLHLGLEDMPLAEARALVGSKMVIGGTANTYGHIVQRIEEGADYVGLGPFRFTTTKQKLSPIVGLEGYRTIMESLNKRGKSLPIIAIGGIRTTDIPDLQAIGVHGVAMSSSVTNPQTRIQTALEIKQYIC